MPRFNYETLLIASHNQGKIAEITTLIQPYGFKPVLMRDLALPEPAETATSFVGNARIKAHHAAQKSNLIALADDSGLSIEVLNGAPGVYSADWAQTSNGRDFKVARMKVQRQLQRIKAPQPHRATFHCVFCLAYPDRSDQIFSGEVYGHLIWPPRGNFGFGYDSIFIPNGYQRSFAEMSAVEKQRISHRTQAFKKLKYALFG